MLLQQEGVVGHGVVRRWRRRRRSHHCVDTRGRRRHGDHVGLFKPHGVGRRETLEGLQPAGRARRGPRPRRGPSRRAQPRHLVTASLATTPARSSWRATALHCTRTHARTHARDTARHFSRPDHAHARRTHTLRHGQGLDSEWTAPRAGGGGAGPGGAGAVVVEVVVVVVTGRAKSGSRGGGLPTGGGEQ